jgi:hypothetical protein
MWRTIDYFNNIYSERYWINEDGEVKNRYDKILKPRDNGVGYLIIDLYYGNGFKKTIAVHRLVAETFCIKKKDYHNHVDHIDNNRKNNNKNNLRFIDRSGNNRNTNRHNETGYRGVSKCKSGKYKSSIRINGIKTHLGIFETAEEASNKYEEIYNSLMEEY